MMQLNVSLFLLPWLAYLKSFSTASSTLSSAAATSAAATTTISHPTFAVDLSYSPHLSASILRNAIKHHATNQEGVVLNLGHSSLGDEKLEEVLEGIMASDSDKEGLWGAELDLSMNQLTHVGVNWLLNQILAAQNGDNTRDAANDDHDDGKKRMPLKSLVLNWNYLTANRADTTVLYNQLEKLVGSASQCPSELSFEQCSVGVGFCRALALGLIHRFLGQEEEVRALNATEPTSVPLPLSLSLCGNPDIGDAGTAAIAAALRTIATSERNDATNLCVLERLDLSACGVGDVGAEALALAVEDGIGATILDLSNNQLTDQGVTAVARAIAIAQGPTVRVLDLSNNQVGEAACTALIVAMAKGRLEKVKLCSCHIHADVAEVIGKGLRAIMLQKPGSEFEIDLSGNPLGVLRGKNKKDGGKYSASRLKSTATATAASYINLLKRGLKDVGVDSMLGVTSQDSDDEDENLSGLPKTQEDSDSSEFTKKRCGAKSLVNAFLRDFTEKRETGSVSNPLGIKLGLRSCFFDHEAADALAAMIVEAKDRYGTIVSLDVKMNPVLEEEMVKTLHGDSVDDDRLREMAERHLDVLEAIQEAEDRAAEARSWAQARSAGRGRLQMWEESESSDFVPDFDDFHGLKSQDESSL